MYKPLPDEVTLKKSKIQGVGLFSTCAISDGTNLGITHIKDDMFENNHARTPLGGFINHSEDPNVETVYIGKYLYLITIKDIMPDEELTLKYKWYKP